MRIVLINHCHPDTPHVCATRFREFSGALARRGHQVVLLTAPLGNVTGLPEPSDIPELLAAHDFAAPFELSTPPMAPGMLSYLRNENTPRFIRQGIVLWYYIVRGGVFTDWRNGARRYLPALASSFEPEIIWSNFGNTDCWNIAALLSTEAECPWVADIKDFWSSFIAAPLRPRLARRYGGAKAFTALSGTHAADARAWFSNNIEIIYSGFRPGMVRTGSDEIPDGKMIFNLTGAVYGREHLQILKAAIEAWLSNLSADAAANIEFIYCGNDAGDVKEVFGGLARFCKTNINGFVPLEKLQEIQRRSFANLYIASARTFHHKVFELFAAGRSIICYPRDNAETEGLAGQLGADFHSCRSSEEIVSALQKSFDQFPLPPPLPGGITAFTWDAQAEKLENILLDAVASDTGNS
ncbi:MAG: hypothetical protein HQ503_09325 [Rhodospirillales bacterium]|nr:hypothetical protein [Rhodospirillales bacterium]